jgi:hypothetical protein
MFLSSWPTFLRNIFIVQGGFCLGISHMYILYCNQINPLYYLFFVVLLPCYSTACVMLHYTIFTHRCIVFQYYLLSTHYHSFLLPPPWSPLRQTH